MKSFRFWLLESGERKYMSRMGFGQHRDKEIQRAIAQQQGVPEVPTSYLQWAADNAQSGQARAKHAEIRAELERRNQPTPRTTQPTSPARARTTRSQTPAQRPPTQQPQVQEQSWIAAKLLTPQPNLGLKPEWEKEDGIDLAMKQVDAANWMFVEIDPEEGTLVNRGVIPAASLRGVIQRQTNAQGELIRGSKPSDILKQLRPKKKKSQTIPDEHISEEQQKIDARFAELISSPEQSHMVLAANAGSGKTTMLKHLAWKYGKPGQRWLYLVFNSKNKEEAREPGEFPPFVQVETTNGFAGREVLDKNRIKKTDRIVDYDKSKKVDLIADGPQFNQQMLGLKIPDPVKIYGPNPKTISKTDRGVWYALRTIQNHFKKNTVKLVGLAKAYSLDPRDQSQFEAKLDSVMNSYDLDTDLEDAKEKIEKQNPWAINYIDEHMGVDFMSRDFREEMKTATTWLLNQTMPHASEEQFKISQGPQQGQNKRLGEVRDFDDDLWFSAIHANELRWPRYDVVLADEVQDFNEAQKVLLQKLHEQGAKIVAVGDKNQAIYRFRGADSSAFDNLEQTLSQLSANKNVRHDLTQNFRSREAVLGLANQEGEEMGHVSNLTSGRPFHRKGKATKYEQSYEDAFETLKSEWQDMGEVKQTAFLSRTNEPLLHSALNLMKDGIPFIILGKDLATDLIEHVNKISNLVFLNKANDVGELDSALRNYHTEKAEKYFVQGRGAKAGRLQELKDITEALTAAIGQFSEDAGEGDTSIQSFRVWLVKRFGGLDPDNKRERAIIKKKLEEGAVTLSTVHKSKGLQFHRVYILRDDLWPHPKSKERPEDLAQEWNNKYIGRTRAEEEIHVLDLEGQPGYEKPGQIR